MHLHNYSPKKIDNCSTQAQTLYGMTEAYQEFAEKSAKRTDQQEKDLGAQIMDFFVRLGKMRPCEPDSEEAQSWAKELQAFFTEHYYACTPHILSYLAESYADGGSMTQNIDAAGGAGTGAFAKDVISIYIRSL